MADPRSSTPVVVLAFLAGLAAGAALAGLVGGSPEVTTDASLVGAGGERGGGVPDGASLPMLRTSGRPAEIDGSGGGHPLQPATEPLAPYRPPAALDLPPGVACWIRVEVISPEPGTSFSGEAYVLGPGAGGVQEIDLVPHGFPEEEQPAVIPLGRPGRYDVGLVWRQSQLLRRDVTVVAGETTTVVFRPPAPQQITVTVAGPLPQRTGWRSLVNVRLSPSGTRERVAYPGREQRRNHGWSGSVGVGTHRLGSLLEGQRVRITGAVYRHRTQPKDETKYFSDVVVVASPPSAGPGENVTIKVIPAARLRVLGAFDLPTWPLGVLRELVVEVEHAGGVDRHTRGVKRYSDNKQGDVYTWILTVPEGPVRVRWSGQDLKAGRHPLFKIHAGETRDVPLALTFTGAHPPVGSGALWVDVVWPKGAPNDTPLELAAVERRRPGGEAETTLWEVAREQEDRRAEPELRSAGTVLGSIGDRYATGPITIPSGDSLVVRPVLGGLVVLAPEVTRSQAMGLYVLRRPDGLPIRTLDDSYESAVSVSVGRVIGPFVPGEHTFQVWLGSQRLPDVKVTVRAGRTSVLVMPE